MKTIEAIKNVYLRIKAYEDWSKFYLSDYSYTVSPRKFNSKLRVRNPSDRFVVDEVFAHSQFDKIPLAEIDTVLDIGAYSGYSALYFACNDCDVAAFEPGPAFSNLKYNIENNDYNITIFEKAVSSSDGKIGLEGGSESTLAVSEEEGDIECISLEKAIEVSGFDEVDLLKLDCEGEEVPIILESPKKVLREFSWMFIEYHSVEGKADIIETLKDAEFSVDEFDSVADNDDGFILAERI